MAENDSTQQGTIITYEVLFDYTHRERNEGKLQSLQNSFLDDVYSYLKERRAFIEKTKKKADVFGQNQIINMEKQFANAIRLLRYLLENREKKIIDMVLQSVRMHADVSEEQAMLPHEKRLYQAIYKIMAHFQSRVLEMVMKGVYDEKVSYSSMSATKELDDFCKNLGVKISSEWDKVENELPENPVEPETAMAKPMDEVKSKEAPDTPEESPEETSEVPSKDNKHEKNQAADTKEQKSNTADDGYTFREELSDDTSSAETKQKTASEKTKQEKTSLEDAPVDDGKPVAIKILKDVDKFIGLDMEVYGPYKEGESAEVPSDVARLLAEKEYAVRNNAGE